MTNPTAQDVLTTYDRQEVSWIQSTVRRMKLIKTIANNIKCHLAASRNAINDDIAKRETQTALEFNQLLDMIADEDIRAGEEQLKNN